MDSKRAQESGDENEIKEREKDKDMYIHTHTPILPPLSLFLSQKLKLKCKLINRYNASKNINLLVPRVQRERRWGRDGRGRGVGRGERGE